MPEQNHILSDLERQLMEAEAKRQQDDGIAVSNAFANTEMTVVSWEGENYYKACGELVHTFDDDGLTHRQTFCVKRVNHPSGIHEDYEGRTRTITEDFDFSDCTLEEAIAQAIGAGSVCWDRIENAGVFQPERARAIADALTKRVREAGPIYG